MRIAWITKPHELISKYLLASIDLSMSILDTNRPGYLQSNDEKDLANKNAGESFKD